MNLRVRTHGTYMSREIPSNGEQDIEKEVHTDPETKEDGERWDQNAENNDQKHESMASVWPSTMLIT